MEEYELDIVEFYNKISERNDVFYYMYFNQKYIAIYEVLFNKDTNKHLFITNKLYYEKYFNISENEYIKTYDKECKMHEYEIRVDILKEKIINYLRIKKINKLKERI